MQSTLSENALMKLPTWAAFIKVLQCAWKNVRPSSYTSTVTVTSCMNFALQDLVTSVEPVRHVRYRSCTIFSKGALSVIEFSRIWRVKITSTWHLNPWVLPGGLAVGKLWGLGLGYGIRANDHNSPGTFLIVTIATPEYNMILTAMRY